MTLELYWNSEEVPQYQQQKLSDLDFADDIHGAVIDEKEQSLHNGN